MRGRHMIGDRGVAALLGRARVARDAAAAMGYIDGGLGGPHIEGLADHAGRHGVEVPPQDLAQLRSPTTRAAPTYQPLG